MSEENAKPSELGRLLTTSQLADLMNVHRNTLARWREKGYGPPYVQVGNVVRYLEKGYYEWVEQNARENKTQAEEAIRTEHNRRMPDLLQRNRRQAHVQPSRTYTLPPERLAHLPPAFQRLLGGHG